MQDLCLCCAKMPIQPPTASQAGKGLRPENIPEEVRQQLPKYELDALLRKDPAFRPALCGLCNSFACDAVAPCRVPAQRWLYLEQVPLLNAAWKYAHALECTWLHDRGTNHKPSIKESKVSDWIAITDNYWRKEQPVVTGTAVAHVLQWHSLAGFLLRVQIFSTPVLVGSLLAAGGADEWELPTLADAQARCEALIAAFSQGWPSVSLDSLWSHPAEGTAE